MNKIFSHLLKYSRLYIGFFLLILIVCLIGLNLNRMRKTTHNWKVKSTQHFLIYYEEDSPAEKDIEILARLLEEYFKETTEMFGVEISKKIPYYFHSKPLYHLNTPVWGYATRKDIHVVYSNFQKDSSPHELRHFIQQIVNPQAPYFFNEGICGLGIQIGNENFHDKVRRECPDLSKYPLLELVKDFKKYGRIGDYLAYSFNSFLVEQYGKEKFSELYRKVTMDNWQKTMEQIYKLSPLELEVKWKSFLSKK